MKSFNLKFKEWMDKASFQDQHRLAKMCDTSRVYLYHLATGWKGKVMSADLAVKIEAATREMNKENDSLPIVLQYDICKACYKCPYANACKK